MKLLKILAIFLISTSFLMAGLFLFLLNSALWTVCVAIGGIIGWLLIVWMTIELLEEQERR